MAKKIFRSSAAKLLAFLLMLACVAGAAGTVGEMFEQIGTESGSEWVYQFESNFQDSGYVSSILNMQLSNLNYALEENNNADSANHFPGDYYGRYGTVIRKNTDLDERAVTSSRFYAIVKKGQMESNIGSRYYLPIMDEDASVPSEAVLMVRLTDQQAAGIEAAWNEQAKLCADTVKSVLLLLICALVLFIYLLFVTGRRPEDEEVHMVTVDRLFAELNVALICVSAGIGIGAYVALLGELSGNGDVAILLWPAVVLLTVCTALSTELLLSIVRNVKNRSFVSRSLFLRACKWCWKQTKRIWRWLIGACKKVWHMLGGAKDTLWNSLSKNYKTRNVVLIFLGYSVVLAIFACMFGFMMDYGEGIMVFILGVLWFVIASAFLINRITGFESIVDALQKLRGGDLSYKLENMPAGIFANMADDINSLGDGMQAALQTEIRAERMKSELITNVSHDLKTPLTSIINYSDLLCQEHLTPEEANDYAKIIYQKSNRLKNLTSDLFDISKVQAGAESIISERLDACTLVRQALAEQEQAVEAGGLALKVTMPEREVPIWADGKKLSRVLENLIGNCVKYAMKNTRVFVTVSEQEERAVLELKNIANYAMDFDSEEITERFVRGDASRTTEGSGLGLAIAKSYVAACGGTLKVDVDGDLFKVTVTFPLYHS
ncbi:sensor histidine kinase [Agathobaculum sp.]|uniref:sensor histidine kinase n=1 Tax=Agathobaculum sp. TaxID=2048138 RepID=UPI002A81E872|nr:histidine kinase dimerization/phospho-acceptor domain-containing protein [Agathobaculum sp.]MDY3617740.1 histidine kinase dimerization/phospho-acceptor domain-containing protein [Agathobaculum sp.]